MHVAFNGYFWNQPRTGSGQYLRHLWAALNDLPIHPDTGIPDVGHDAFTMLLPPGFHAPQSPDDALPTGPRFHTAQGRRFPLLGGRSGNLDKLLWESWSVARMAKQQRAQLLHVPYLTAPAPLPGVKSCPVVVTAHDMIPWILPGYSGSAAVRLYLAVAAASVKRADLILADSEASRTDVIKVLRVPPRKVRTIYLGMEPHPEYPSAEIAAMRARLRLSETYAFYLGGFDTRKNVPLLLRAWRAVLDSLGGDTGEKPLLAIGGAIPQPGGVHPDIMGEATRLGLDEPDAPVRFLGRVSEADKPLLMAGARLFVYPSAYEGFGLDPLEAMSVGCPVVASSGGSIKEVVGDAGLLVPPGDETALTHAITRAWQDPPLLSDLSRRGRQRAQQFTWQRTARETRQAYSDVAREAEGRRQKAAVSSKQ